MNISPLFLNRITAPKLNFKAHFAKQNPDMDFKPSFKIGNLPHDIFKLGTTSNAKDVIAGSDADYYYFAGKDLSFEYRKYFYPIKLCDEGDLDKTLLTCTDNVSGESIAIPLKSQPFIANLKDDEKIRLTNNLKTSKLLREKRPKEKTIALPIAHGGAIIEKHNGKYYIDGIYDLTTTFGLFNKKEERNNIENNLFCILPQNSRSAQNYRENLSNAIRLPKNRRVKVCNLADLKNPYECNVVLILPNRPEKGERDIVFDVCRQKRLQLLKDGESVVIGRYKENQNRDRMVIPKELSNNTISENHLVFENIEGVIYLTDISKNGTMLARSDNYMSPEAWYNLFCEIE